MKRASSVTVVYDDPDLLDLLSDVFASSHHVAGLSRVESMTGIAEQRPDVLVIGPLATPMNGSLGAWEIVALARCHRELRGVPVILLAVDLDTLMSDGRLLATYSGVHVVGLPFELEVMTSVLRSVERTRTATLAERQADTVGPDRLPTLCAHGYALGAGGMSSGCSWCSPAVAALAR